MSYVELCSKSNFSFLRGASHPQELVERARDLGITALGIADRNGVYGLPRAYRAAREIPGFNLISGAELTVAGREPLVFLARDRKGYGLLCRMITASHADKPKGEAVLQWNELLRFLDRKESKGLLAIAKDDQDLDSLRERLDDRLLFALPRLLDGLDRKRTMRAKEIQRRYGIKILATNDVHYHEKQRQALHDVLTSIREGTTLENAGRKLFSNGERYLKSPQMMQRLFSDMPEALQNTLEAAEDCKFSLSELRYRYPSEWIPEGETALSHLRKLVFEGAKERYPEGVPNEVLKQIGHELNLVDQLGFSDYFLTIWEIVDFAKSRKILCQGRGSAANSVICYCLGITAIDPVRMNLLFERFISAERGEPPDIDVDFEHERREEVIQHVYEKYGRDRAAMVAAVITYRSKMAKREISKVLHVDKLVDKAVDELRGSPRHLSIHSGGFTLSADPIIETVPIEPARMEGRTIVQWDKDDLDTLGLLKVDLLSLGMLSAIRKACDMTGLTLASIPADDKKTYAMIQEADTVGVFQIESRAQMNMLGRLKPEKFYDLVVQIAIVRPGPIVGGMVHPYLKCRRGEAKPYYPHPALKLILERTLGVPLFQEQIMKIAIELAGFSPGEADELRRAIGAWRSSGSIDKMGRRLMEGLLKSGLPPKYVEQIFERIKGFAEYGFPESHSASFALLAYASSYLKCHHPAEFTCALINSQPMGFYANHTLVDDAKRHGVKVLPVNPHFSEWDCSVTDGVLRLGWRIVSGLSKKEADALIAARERNPFRNLADFLERTQLRPNVLHCLALGGALACFGLDRRHTLWEILSYDGQRSLFSGLQNSGEGQDKIFNRLDSFELVQADYSSYHLSTLGHPMQVLRPKFENLPKLTAKQVKESPNGRVLSIAGMAIVRQRPPTAKGTVFATMEDESGFIDLVLHAETFKKYEELFLSHVFLVARGELQRDGASASLIVKSLKPIWKDANSPQKTAGLTRHLDWKF